ncbi:hypothetical protein [Nocardia sp. NPDC057272]|uniref:hypothetical protein n=1 Tax=Nocardia sp. NPDC057272 TaxID=3346079 RepID=UPI0036419B1B
MTTPPGSGQPDPEPEPAVPEQRVLVQGESNTTIVAGGAVYYTAADSGRPTVSLERGEFLQRRRMAARSRREIRRTGAGLTTEQVNRSQNVLVELPNELVTGPPSGHMRALIGPLGSGKSDIAEQWHIVSIDRAEVDERAPVPVWISARVFTTSVEDLVVAQLRDRAELESVGVDVVIDGLDERTETASEIIGQAAQFVSDWPRSRVLLTSRSQDGIPERNRIEVLPLSGYAAERLMRAVAGRPVGPLNDALAAAVKRPLFALLVARHVSAASGVTGIPELIDLVIDDVITKVGYDSYEQLQRLAVETIKGGRPVNPERFTTADVAARVRTSPMLTVSGRDCAFSLATFEQWFAAKALLQGTASIEELLVSLQAFDRWKYVLAIVLAAGEPERADPIIAAVARWNPGALAWLIRESRAGGLARHRPDFGPDDWERIGRRLRDTAIAMIEGLGPLAQATYPVRIGGDPDLSGITLAVDPSGNRLTLAWLISNEVPDDPLESVTSFPLDFTDRTIQMRTERPTTGVNWVWAVMQRHLAGDIDDYLDSTARQLALQVESIVRKEYNEAQRQRRAAWNLPDASPAESVVPLYPPPDIAADYSNPWDSYSPAMMQQRVQQVIEAGLRCYRELCELLAPRFGDTLGHLALMPVQFYGNIGYHPDQKKGPFEYPGPVEPGFSWFLKPVGTPTRDGRRRGDNSVSITLNDNDRSEEIRDDRDILDHVYVKYFDALPALSPFQPSFSTHHGRFDTRSESPATDLALLWLREDLMNLEWLQT